MDDRPETVIRLAARGDGVTSRGRFLPLAAPGDTLDGDTLIPGPNRALPPCRHFPACGGCALQHIADPALAVWAAERIAHALGVAGVRPRAVLPTHLSPPRSRRRATLRAVATAGGLQLGFHAEGTHQIVDMHECHVLHPALFALVAPVRALLTDRFRPGEGGGAGLTLTDTGVDLLLSNVVADPADLAAFAAEHDLARLSVEGPAGVETIVQARAPALTLGGAVVHPPPAPFLQATADGEAALVSAVLATAAGARHAADLFCGLGTFALPLAAAGVRVTAADASGPSIAALARAAAGRPLVPLHRDLFRRPLTPAELAPFDLAVIDPPRAGAREQCEALARSRVPRLAMVSCNPATFARDAAILTGGGFHLERLWPVAQFRWSTHLELAAEFLR